MEIVQGGVEFGNQIVLRDTDAEFLVFWSFCLEGVKLEQDKECTLPSVSFIK